MIHASCVALAGRAVLIRGPSGSGKSDLALRLIDEGAILVADDQVELAREDDRLLASAPQRIAGLIEVRGIGLVCMPWLERVPVALIVDLVTGAEVERLPEPREDNLGGVVLPVLDIVASAPSAGARIRLGLRLRSAGEGGAHVRAAL